MQSFVIPAKAGIRHFSRQSRRQPGFAFFLVIPAKAGIQ